MALSELAALDAAYQTLRPLDPAGRRRALQWLSDALAAETTLPRLAAGTAPAAATDQDLEAAPAVNARSSTARRAARQPRRAATAATAEAAPPASAAKRTRDARTGRTAKASPRKRAQANAHQSPRAYRRMPPADEVMAAYRRVGSVSALAEHFDVPQHTVQGWARQLRRHGHSIGQTR